ncbi:MAG TPA: maleylacetate reductase [Solirubrobacterales bacterium]|nr:maleylacetate reductase [Solirubrobacterales bacterium]
MEAKDRSDSGRLRVPDRPSACVAAGRFVFEALPSRTVFGWGTSADRLGPELAARGAERILVLCTEAESHLAAAVTAPFEDHVVAFFPESRPHVPIEVAEAARLLAAEHNADWLLSIGGGSTTGLAKAIALKSGLPIAAVPTTYAGSEVTPIWGITADGRKKTGRAPGVLPSLVVYDPALTTTLPVSITVTSAFNAIAHCVESFYAPGRNPVTTLFAEEGIRALASSLQDVVRQPEGRAGREGLLYGSFLAGSAFAVAGSGLHHKICHVLGGSLDLPHAETHTVVLPQVLGFNEPAMPAEVGRICRALPGGFQGVDGSAAAAVFDLIDAAGGPVSLAELGMRRAHVAGMVEEILEVVPEENPRPVSADDVFSILDAAFEGRRPSDILQPGGLGGVFDDIP